MNTERFYPHNLTYHAYVASPNDTPDREHLAVEIGDDWYALDEQQLRSLDATVGAARDPMALRGSGEKERVIGAARAWARLTGVRRHATERAAFLALGCVRIGENSSRELYALVVNSSDAPTSSYARERLFDMSTACGHWTACQVCVWATSLENALETFAEYLAENAPGLLTSEEEIAEIMKEVAEEEPRRAGESDDDFELRIHEAATADLTYTESGYLTSHEWHGSEVDNPVVLRDAMIVTVRDRVAGDCWDEHDAERFRPVFRELR